MFDYERLAVVVLLMTTGRYGVEVMMALPLTKRAV